MKILTQLVRLPLDLVLLTFDWFRTLPNFFSTVFLRNRRACEFCDLAQVNSKSNIRLCEPAKKYGNLWAFKTICPCVEAPTLQHPTPYCQRPNPYRRPVFHLPFIGLLLALLWFGLVAGIARLAGVPIEKKIVAALRPPSNTFPDAHANRDTATSSTQTAKQHFDNSSANLVLDIPLKSLNVNHL